MMDFGNWLEIFMKSYVWININLIEQLHHTWRKGKGNSMKWNLSVGDGTNN